MPDESHTELPGMWEHADLVGGDVTFGTPLPPLRIAYTEEAPVPTARPEPLFRTAHHAVSSFMGMVRSEGDQCPVCGSPDGALKWHLGRGDFVTVWRCHFAVCDDPYVHAFRDDVEDGCGCCGKCPRHCNCVRCVYCDENARPDEICYGCNRCHYHCDCGRCSSCGDPVSEPCEDCGGCRNCCRCRRAINSWNFRPSEVLFVGDEDVQHVYADVGLNPVAPDDQPYLGLEIEVETDGTVRPQRLASFWKDSGFGYAKHDGSLDDGVELVVSPHTFKALVRHDLASTLDELRNMGARAWEGGRCGLHIHVSRRAFADRAHTWRFVTAIPAMERTLQRLGGRGSNRYATWDFATNSQYPKPSRVIAGKDYPGERYAAVNLNNAATIELRFFRGSVRPMTVLGCAALVDALLQWTRDLTLEDVNELFDFLDDDQYEESERHAAQQLTWERFCEWSAEHLPPTQWEYITTLAAARRVDIIRKDTSCV